MIRQVPLPDQLLCDLEEEFSLRASQMDAQLAAQPLWPWSRTTPWRYLKAVKVKAEVTRSAAMPKGMRHAFGVAAIRSSVPPNLVQRWLGRASLETASIYADVAGQEEREFAARVWAEHQQSDPVKYP